MHILELTTRVDVTGEAIEPGRYLIDDVMGAQLLVFAGGGTMEPLERDGDVARFFSDNGSNFLSLMLNPDNAGVRILFMRPGGFGDLVLLTPVLREIKRRWPTSHVAVATMEKYAPVLQNLSFVDEIVQYPVRLETAKSYDIQIFYEKAIEHNPRAQELHATDLYAEIAGLTGEIPDKLPAYVVKVSEGVWAAEGYPKHNRRRVCIQPFSSAPARNYPMEHWGKVIDLMLKNHYEVLLLGEPGEIKLRDAAPVGLRNLSLSGLAFRQSCAVLNTADVFIGNDSALLHIAGALGVPAVGIYGPFPYKLRTAYCPTTYCFQGTLPCAPCFHHVNHARKNHFPGHCPSKEHKLCAALAQIKPEGIVAKALEIAR